MSKRDDSDFSEDTLLNVRVQELFKNRYQLYDRLSFKRFTYLRHVTRKPVYVICEQSDQGLCYSLLSILLILYYAKLIISRV